MSDRARRLSDLRRFGQIGLLPPAALAVHQLRFMLAYGSGAGAELQRTGHSYLHSLVPWVVLLITLAVGGFLRSLAHALKGRTSRPCYTVSLSGVWLGCSLGLVAIYTCQEFLEGVFAAAHPAGLVGIFGYGGWWAIPSAVVIGLVLAAALLGARWVVRAVAASCTRRHSSRQDAPVRPRLRARDAFSPVVAPLAGGWSVRGPPM